MVVLFIFNSNTEFINSYECITRKITGSAFNFQRQIFVTVTKRLQNRTFTTLSFNSNVLNLLYSDLKISNDKTKTVNITPKPINQYNDLGQGRVRLVIKNIIIKTLDITNLFSLLAFKLFLTEMLLVLLRIKAESIDKMVMDNSIQFFRFYQIKIINTRNKLKLN